MSRILIADDEAAICAAMSELLSMDGHQVITAADGLAALAQIESGAPDLVFMDIQMPHMTGLEALAEIRERWPRLPVIMMTAYGTMQTAMDTVRLGAFEYLGKPVDIAQVRALVNKALPREAAPAAAVLTPADAPEARELIGQSPAMQEVYKLIGLVAENDLTVLISGESGVGKELVARAIHQHSRRSADPFVAVNCAAIPDNLIESELFGHERGAFSGATGQKIGRFGAAGAGTLFLDEIGELNFDLQSKLLRVLQEREFERIGSTRALPVRARVLAATNRQLPSEVDAGRFREDLYHRLNLVHLQVPPLRKRGQDIDLLAQRFLQQANAELNRQIHGFSPQALEALRHHDWPGNVRELENLIRKTVLTTRGTQIDTADLALDSDHTAAKTDNTLDTLREQIDTQVRALLRALIDRSNGSDDDPSPFHRITEQVESTLVDEAMRISDGNQVSAARLLKLNRTTLRKRLDKPVQ